MRHKLALTIALAVLMAVVAGASLAAAESQVKPAGAGAGSGQPTTPAAPPVVAPGTPIGGGVEAAPPLQGTITAPPDSGGAAPQIGSNSEETPTPSGGTTPGSGAASPPSTSFTPIGPAPLGVPNFLIDSFEIPPFLLPIYQACGTQYDIPWQVLASINKIESAFGTNLNVSSAGAMGWMQFIPSTWASYGVDANADGRKDPYNPVDAICAAARYLRAAGGESDLYNAIFAYNHADWYVQEVLLYARGYGKLPDQLVGSLTGLTEGAHFPVAADARYSDAISTDAAAREAKPTPGAAAHNAAQVVGSAPGRTGIDVYSKPDAPVVAVNDGAIKAIGSSPQLGRYIVLQDAYGNRYTYGNLGEIVRDYPVPKPQPLSAADFKLITPTDDKKPTAPATKTTVKENALNTVPQPGRPESEGPGPKAPDADTGSGTGTSAGAAPAPDATSAPPADATAQSDTAGSAADAGASEDASAAGGGVGPADQDATGAAGAPSDEKTPEGEGAPHSPKVIKPSVVVPSGAGPAPTDTGGKGGEDRQRAYALPSRPHVEKVTGGGTAIAGTAGYATFNNYYNDVYAYDSSEATLKPMRVGSRVIGGTVLGRVGDSGSGSHVSFAIRPAGKRAPAIDPKPILDGWKLLEATAIYRSTRKNLMTANLGVGGVLLLSKEALQRRVLNDPRLSIYSCGRADIASGQVDRRLLAAMEYLAEKGFRLTITSVKCGHSFLTASGSVSEHSSGNAMDIAVINDVPVIGNQGPGSLTDALIKSLLQLQGTMAPHQIISLEDLPGPQSIALSDHHDHVHVGYYPDYGTITSGYTRTLKPAQWKRLVKRLGQIQNPQVAATPSGYSLEDEGSSEQGGAQRNGNRGD